MRSLFGFHMFVLPAAAHYSLTVPALQIQFKANNLRYISSPPTPPPPPARAHQHRYAQVSLFLWRQFGSQRIRPLGAQFSASVSLEGAC